MSSSTPPPHSHSHSHSSFPAPLPAVASHELPGGTYHDSEEGGPDGRTKNNPGTFESRGVPEESVQDSDLEEAAHQHTQRRQGHRSLWARGFAVVSSSFASPNRHPRWLRKPTRSCCSCCSLYCVVAFLTFLGILQFFYFICGIVTSSFPDEIDRVTDHWRQPQSADLADTTHWPTDISRDIFAVPCHSHNDYWRRIPLYSALEAGCIGVEADVWLSNDELLVGHSVASLKPSRTLQSMYIDPLMQILQRQNPITHLHPDLDQPRNGVFDTDPSQPLILLIDFKSDGEESWDHVYSQLNPLRKSGYLTYYNGSHVVNGPITVVGTGNAPFNRIAENTTYRDIFFDAPLNRLEENVSRTDTSTWVEEQAEHAGQGLSRFSNDIVPVTFDNTNSYYASVSFKKAVGKLWRLHLTDHQVQTIRSQIRAAHSQGLKVRYWGTPGWPRSLRNHVWRVLAHEGVDMLNVDDLVSATRKDWAPRFSDWWY
ncbi:PLC-like phosphodiesterase [Aspergillus varians]